MAVSLLNFLLAGICEIGGGYLIWLWLKNDKGIGLGLLGAALLVVYGIVATFQNAPFGRVYAAYGGVFVALSLLWGWKVDQTRPDIYDLVGTLIVLLGVTVMMYMPRGS